MKRVILPTLALLALAAAPAFAQTINHWHVSTYWAEYIEGHGIGNHALYCGDETIPACEYPDTTGGVGRSWFDDVEWRRAVADPYQTTTVNLSGVMLYDLPDAGWDFLELYVQRGEELDMLDTWTGSVDTTVTLDYSAQLYPGEYVGPDENEVRLVWRVWTSVDGWDDEDCINPSHGACQIDDLTVSLDGYPVTFDDFEPGNPVNWEPVDESTAAEEAPAIARVAVAAHPNPFNPKTTLSFELPRAAEVTLAVFDSRGRQVRGLLESASYPAGRHHQEWDGRDDQGQAAVSGVYFYRFNAGQESRTGKLTILK